MIGGLVPPFKLMETNNTYIVFVGSVKFADSLSIEDSVSLALNLHRFSNVPHSVQVFSNSNENVLSLIVD